LALFQSFRQSTSPQAPAILRASSEPREWHNHLHRFTQVPLNTEDLQHGPYLRNAWLYALRLPC
jgi:hypothetical protein